MLSKLLSDHRIILASGSPRRQQFLRDMGLEFTVQLKEVDEIFPDTLRGSDITDYLAQLKADAFLGELGPKDLLITSDTIVWLQGQAIGKPRDFDDATAILQKLSGQTHQVFTSVCLRTPSSNTVFHEETHVQFSDLDPSAIEHYLKTFKPFDKAGAYGIQDWIGLIGIVRIEGSYTNVVGLPTEKLYRYLIDLSQNNELT